MFDHTRVNPVDQDGRLALAPDAYLRVLTEEDATQPYVEGLNDPAVYRFMTATRRSRQTLDSVRAYIRANAEDDTAILFGLFIDGALRGTVRLHSIGLEAASAHIGITIFDTAYWGKGWARRAIAGAVAHAFDTVGLDRVYAGIYAANLSSQKAFAHAGFRYLAGRDHIDDLGLAQLWSRERSAQ
jgi:ribosomal-protein-alanine N-acetyltransferase